MKVILKEDVKSVGRTGDVLTVSDGYARNYLIPKGLAVEASEKNVKSLDSAKKSRAKKDERMLKNVEAMVEKLKEVAVTISRKVGDQEKLFGSVTAKDIESALKEAGVDIDRKKLQLEEPIKQLGEYKVGVKLHPGISGEVTVNVVIDE